MRERAYIKYLRSIQGTSRNVVVGIGDDCAAVRLGQKGLCLLTTDTLLDGTHFQLKHCTAWEVGRKAVACGLSDIASMGCKATLALVSIAFPRFSKMGFAKELFRGMRDMATKYGVAIVGGDTVSGKGPLCINVTVLGMTEGLHPLLRSGARPGDAIMVTGTLGGSILGRHLSFEPRLTEGLYLNKNFPVHSMIDISDGLSIDLGHIMEESQVGAVLYQETIPISQAAYRLARTTRLSPLHHALTDGEDYELLFTLGEPSARRLLEKNPIKVLITRIGHIRRQKGLFLQGKDGRLRCMKPQGYEHR